VLHRDVLVLQALGLCLRFVEEPGQPLGDHHLAGLYARAAHLGPAGQLRLDLGLHASGVGARLGQQPGHQPLGLVEEGEEQVLPVHFGVAEPQRLGLGVVQGFLGLLGEAVQVHRRSVPPKAERGR
jgi:hypothetical protein